MAVTIKEIANMCGVSPGTVDRALNNRPGISDRTKKKILKLVKKLNYQPDHMARSLAKGRTMTLGVVLFDLYNRSFAQLMNAVELKSRELGYYVHLVLTEKDKENEKYCIENLVSRKVDGIILFSVNKGEQFNEYLKTLNIPIVTIFNHVSDDWQYIGINDRQAMKDAVHYIWERNYRKYIFICPPLAYRDTSNIFTQEERLIGCMEGLQELQPGNEPIVIQEKNFLRALDRLELKGPEKTVIMCSCDIYALEVMNHLKSKGLQVPHDVGLMGFDHIDVLKYVTPALTTVEYAVEEFGVKAVECLVSQIEHADCPSIPLLDYKIIPGDSI
jgi:LacI family transcriptional regulator